MLVRGRLGLPLLTAADLGDDFLDGTNQRLILAVLAPKDLFLYHGYVDNMEVVMVHIPPQGLRHGPVALIGVHHSG